jgi:hypothetical protein
MDKVQKSSNSEENKHFISIQGDRFLEQQGEYHTREIASAPWNY